MPDDSSATPLLHSSRHGDGESHRLRRSSPGASAFVRYLRRCRRTSRQFLASRTKHFVIMAIVALDVAALLANVFIQLIACEMHQIDEPWVQLVTKGLETAGLVFSSLFVLELAACLFAFGFSYLGSWFHLFDSAVIVASFVIDLASQGLGETIGSLLVVLRLWRLAKISEEVVLGAAERMEILEQQLEELAAENDGLRAQLRMASQNHSGRPVEEA